MKRGLSLILPGLAVCLPLALRPLPARAVDESPIDLVNLRLFRNETRRWIQQGFIPADDSFEDWAFGGDSGESKFHSQLDAALRGKLRSLDRVYPLSRELRRKLLLAGRGDIKRLLEMIDEARLEFEGARLDVQRLPQLRHHLLQIDLRISRGLFESGSILAKTLGKLETERELTPRRAAAGH